MSTAPSEQVNSGAEPDFVIPGWNVISEGNWPEYQAKGFTFLKNQDDPANASNMSELGRTELFHGSGRVFTGAAFDVDEGRPLAHKPGIGIYLAPDTEHQSGPGAGPASS